MTDNMDRDNMNADSFNTDKINTEELEALLKKAGKLFADRNAAAHTREKGVADYVTEVDFAVQKFIRRRLEELYPEVQFLSEEKSNEEIDKNGLVWVLDPVDGTTNLIHDYRASVISLALMQKGTTNFEMEFGSTMFSDCHKGYAPKGEYTGPNGNYSYPRYNGTEDSVQQTLRRASLSRKNPNALVQELESDIGKISDFGSSVLCSRNSFNVSFDTSIQPLLPSYILLVFPTYLYAKSLTK